MCLLNNSESDGQACHSRASGPGVSCIRARGGTIEIGAASVLESPGVAHSTDEPPRVLGKLDRDHRAWTEQVRATESEFHRAIGAADGILAYAKSIGQRWMQDLGVAKLLAERRNRPQAT